jgi:phosphohistidine swiveling domain-containing protein
MPPAYSFWGTAVTTQGAGICTKNLTTTATKAHKVEDKEEKVSQNFVLKSSSFDTCKLYRNK